MKRLYFLTHSLDSVSQINDDLRREGISSWNLQVMSQDEVGLYHRRIHSAHIFNESDVIHFGEIGAMLGATSGLVTALIMNGTLSNPFSSSIIPLIVLTIVFALFGAWTGGLAGVTRENFKLKQFQKALDQGAYLIILDLHKPQVTPIKQQLARHHPEVRFAGQDTSWTLPFHHSFWVRAKRVPSY